MAFLAVFGYCVRQALRMGTDYWLALWSEASVYAQSMTRGSTNTTYDVSSNMRYSMSHRKCILSAEQRYTDMNSLIMDK